MLQTGCRGLLLPLPRPVVPAPVVLIQMILTVPAVKQRRRFLIVSIQMIFFVVLCVVKPALPASSVYEPAPAQRTPFHMILLRRNAAAHSAAGSMQLLPRGILHPNPLFSNTPETYARHSVHVCYGSSLDRSRGNNVVSLTLSSPTSFIVKRSRPIPSPPCFGIPYLNVSRY